jgi:hypothetical protein
MNILACRILKGVSDQEEILIEMLTDGEGSGWNSSSRGKMNESPWRKSLLSPYRAFPYNFILPAILSSLEKTDFIDAFEIFLYASQALRIIATCCSTRAKH